MGRPRQYGSGAARQRAFRQRLEAAWPRVNGEGLARLHEQMLRLQAAVGSAAEVGDETAQACSAASVETVLERVIQQFEARARERKEKAVRNPPP